MSHKSGRRSRKVTATDGEPSFIKPPLVKVPEETPTVDEEIVEKKTPEKSAEQNGERQTRSRSSTPKVRKTEENVKVTNGNNGETDKLPEIQEEVVVETSPSAPSTSSQGEVTNGHGACNNVEVGAVELEQVEMDPLILGDDPDPELVFDDNSDDLESGKESPALSRCRTRRSQIRNIPTPKTPKVDEEAQQASPIVVPEPEADKDLELTYESVSDGASTRAEPGGDTTRFEFMAVNSTTTEDSNSFLETSKSHSFGEALRKLSTRRTIRPIGDEYRKRVFQSHVDSPYPKRASVEKISDGGLKRKLRGENGDNDGHKRFKPDSPGFFSRFISPLASIRSSFRGENVLSSTPKLTGYKDERYLLDNDGNKDIIQAEGKNAETGWCSIM